MPANRSIQTEEVAPEEIVDLIVFHDKLNPKFWDESQRMHPEVRLHLLQTAKAFYDFIDIPKLKVSDIVVVGSNAAYNYTERMVQRRGDGRPRGVHDAADPGQPCQISGAI